MINTMGAHEYRDDTRPVHEKVERLEIRVRELEADKLMMEQTILKLRAEVWKLNEEVRVK